MIRIGEREQLDVEAASDRQAVRQEKVKPTYHTEDIWQAAYLQLLGVEMIAVQLDECKRADWLFDNAGDRAWQLGREFRLSHQAIVPVQDYRYAYRRVAQAAAVERRGASISDHTTE